MMIKNIKILILLIIIVISIFSFTIGYTIGTNTNNHNLKNPNYKILQYIVNPKPYTVKNVNMPVTYYGYLNGKYIGYQITPHNVNGEARSCFYKYMSLKNKDPKMAKEYLYRGLFLTDYLISQSEEESVNLNGTNITYIIWRYNFDFPVYNLSKGWAGSLCQAGCMKTLYLAYATTGDKRYLNLSKKALNAFKVPVEKGGLLKIRYKNNISYYWYPEYASDNPPYVLNGFITSVMWIGEYSKNTNNSDGIYLYNEGIKSLKAFIPDYDYNHWSYYDAKGHLCNTHYQHLQRLQMLWLYNLTGDDLFLKYYHKWTDVE